MTIMQHSLGPLPKLPLAMEKFQLKRALMLELDISKEGPGGRQAMDGM